MNNSEKFETLNVVKTSLIFLYLALTFPTPFICSNDLKVVSIIFLILGLILIVNITNDYVITDDKSISYKVNFSSKFFGKKDWKIFWSDIKLIKSLKTSQGSKVHYFITNKEESYLIPQRIYKLEKFVSLISLKTNLDVASLGYISPIWTYKLLSFLSITMLIGEVFTFVTKYYQ